MPIASRLSPTSGGVRRWWREPDPEPAPPAPTPPPTPPDSTWIERRLYRALARLGVRYQPQRWFGRYCVDAYLPDDHLALEADGCLWHNHAACGYADATPGASQKRWRRDRDLRTRYGLEVVHLWGCELSTDDDALDTVRDALAWERIRIFRQERTIR